METERIYMKPETKQWLTDILVIIFLTGETRMFMVWLLFIVGLIIGGILF
jgi:hypothetical protein